MNNPDNRQKNFEYKLVSKALADLDARIIVPQRVRGASMRHLLDEIPLPSVPEENKPRGRSILFPDLRRFRLQSALSYVAAFALIVALFYGLGFNRTDIVSGVVPISSGSSEPVAAPFAAFEQGVEETAQDEPARAERALSPESTPQQQQDNAAGDLNNAPEILALGGGGKSVAVLEQDGYTYMARQNDATDPDKGAYPVTLEIVEDATALMLSQIDIADMRQIEDCFVDEGFLVVAGIYDGTVVLRGYDIADKANPQELSAQTQPGKYLGARLNKGMVHALSLAAPELVTDYEILEIPNSTSNDICVITGFSANGETVAQKAFLGATEDVTLFTLNAYIYYNSQESADDMVEIHCAQIRLDGANIELAGIM